MLATAFVLAGRTLVERLKRREMANLGGVATIALVLSAPPQELASRLALAAALNVFVYFNNDVLDAAVDAQTPARRQDHARAILDNRGAAWLAQAILLAAIVTSAAWFGGDTLCAVLAGGGVCLAYSAWLKRRAYADVVAMLVWGIAMPSLGFEHDRSVGWILAGQLGLFSACFETVQTLRDRTSDQAAGVRTTAVALGPNGTRALLRAFILLSSVYAAAMVSPWVAPVVAAAVFVPLHEDRLPTAWDRIRVLFGVAWIAAAAAVYLQGGTHGAFLSIDLEATLPFSLCPWS